MALAASATLPDSVLNATNRRLRERINELSSTIADKKSRCEEHRSVTEKIHNGLLLTNKQIALHQNSLQKQTQEVTRLVSESKTLQHEIDTLARRERSSRAENAAVANQLSLTGAAVEQRRKALKASLALTEELGAAAYQVVQANYEACRALEDLKVSKDGAALDRLWLAFERASQALRDRQNHLQRLTDEHRAVLSELEACRGQLRGALRDHADSVAALQLVQTQVEQADAAVTECGEQMRGLLTERAAMERERATLAETLEQRLLPEREVLRRASEQRRALFESRVRQVRDAAEELRRQHDERQLGTQRLRVDSGNAANLRESLRVARERCEEKRSQVAQLVTRVSELEAVLAQLAKEERAHYGETAPGHLHQLLDSAARHLAALESRQERTAVQLHAATSAFIVQAERGSELNDRVVERQREVEAVSREGAAVRAQADKRHDTLKTLQTQLSRLSEQLPALAREEERVRLARRETLRRTLADRQAELQTQMRRFREWLRGVTALRVSLRAAQTGAPAARDHRNNLAEQRRLLESESVALASEHAAAVEARLRGAAELAQCQNTFTALTALADAQVAELQQSAGTAQHLRARYADQVDAITAQQQRLQLELNLLRAELHEHTDELQRKTRTRDLVRARHTDMMAALSRQLRASAASTEAAAPALSGLPGSAATTAGDGEGDVDPETIHARILLQRSHQRERLMARGNYLDLRLVSLERERRTLERTLAAMRGAGGTAAAAAAAAGAAPSSSSSTVRGPSAAAPSAGVAQLVRFTQESAASLAAELEVQNALLEAMRQTREETQARLADMRQTLQELRVARQQRRVKLQQLRRAAQTEVRTSVAEGERVVARTRRNKARATAAFS